MKWKKPISLLLALLLTLSACGASSAAIDEENEAVQHAAIAADTFSDIDLQDEYAESVGWCLENKLMLGVSDTYFDPDGTLTRAMAVTILYRAEGEPPVDSAPIFTDVKTDTWYSNAVTWATDQKIVQGYGNHVFGTKDPVSVEQLEVILGRYTGDGPAWTGDPTRAHAATRAQMAAALYQTLKQDTAQSEPTPTPCPSKNSGGSAPIPAPTSSPVPMPSDPPQEPHSNVLVAFFSYTDHTRDIAEKIADATGGDLFEILPAEPYPSDTTNYYDEETRAYQEQRDAFARPAIAAEPAIADQEAYDTIFLGYPIWYGAPPKIIYTFLEEHDFSGKTIVTFSTSSSSAHNDDALRPLAPDSAWLAGHRFPVGASRDDVDRWLDTLNLPRQEVSAMRKILLTFNGYTYTATLEDNSSAEAFSQLLTAGPLRVSAHDYGSFEKVGELGTSLPRNDTQITTVPGDIILYQGNQITVYYAQNSWSFTRRGRIDDPSGLREALGSGDVEITFALVGGEESGGPFDLAAGQVTLNSGYTMPINGLGTYSLHGDTCVNAVKSALQSGVRLFDTASAYGNEAEVGQALREGMEELGIHREEIFVITKIYPGSEMADPETSIQSCLDRLDPGYVDMMLLHHPDPNDVNAYQAMEKFVADGKIRSLGLSNWYVSELTSFLPQVSVKPALVQNEIHPYYQENDVIPFIQEQGITIQGWYPLGGRGHTAELLGDPVISAIAAAHGVSSAQVILRWNLQKGVVVIPGSSDPNHIAENTQLYHFSLTNEEMARINALDRHEKHDWY